MSEAETETASDRPADRKDAASVDPLARAVGRLDFALTRLSDVVGRLVVYPDAMRRNLDALGGLVVSQRVLLALTQAGMSREDAYAAVQGHAMKVWAGEGSFLERLQGDPEITAHLDGPALAALFDPGDHTRHVDTIFSRVFGDSG